MEIEKGKINPSYDIDKKLKALDALSADELVSSSETRLQDAAETAEQIRLRQGTPVEIIKRRKGGIRFIFPNNSPKR